MKIFLAGLLFIALSYFVYQLTRPSDVPTSPPAAETVQPVQPSAAAESEPIPKPAPAAVTHALFKNPVTPAVFELPSGALTVWREFAAHKPTLVLFSIHPLLDPLPDADLTPLRRLITTGAASEIVRRGQFLVPDPAFLSPQTVSAAIDAGLIGELVFVQPTLRDLADVSLEVFQARAYNAGFLSPEEANALTLQEGTISGKVRGIPFRVVHPDALPTIDRPVIVHIDLGYFKDLFVDEIKTPLYALLGETATAIRDAGYPALAVTLSYSNKEVLFSLDSRFMISNLADLLVNPSLMQSELTPPNWALRSQAMLASAMLSKSTSQELIAKSVAIASEDPDALYALAQQKFQLHQASEAFTLLDRAVTIDPGYALAYLELAETGVDLAQLEKSLELLKKAAKTFPDNPFIRIRLADLLIRNGRGKEALPLLTALKRLPWSESYHPGVAATLDEMIAAAK